MQSSDFVNSDTGGGNTFDRILDSIEAGIRGARGAAVNSAGITPLPPANSAAAGMDGNLMLLGLVVVAILLLSK